MTRLWRHKSFILSTTYLFSGFALLASTEAIAANRALLLNGAGPKNSQCQFFSDIEMMKKSFGETWQVSVLSSDGDEAGYDSPQCKKFGDILVPSGARGADGELLMQNTPQAGAQPATVAGYKSTIEKLATDGSATGDKILLYNTDHCSAADPANSTWRTANPLNIKTTDADPASMMLLDGNINVAQNRELIAKIPDDRTVIMMPDCCFSELQLLALFDEKDGALIPKHNRCGFASSSGDEYAYSGQKGYTRAYTNLMERYRGRTKPPAFDDLHRMAAFDPNIDQVPRATSNIFLSNYADRSEPPCDPAAPILNQATLDSIADAQRSLLKRKRDRMEVELKKSFELADYPFTASEAQIKKDYDSEQALVDKLFAELQQTKVKMNAAHLAYLDTLPAYKALETKINDVMPALELAEQQWLETTGGAAGMPVPSTLVALRKSAAELTIQKAGFERGLTAKSPAFASWIKEHNPGVLEAYTAADSKFIGEIKKATAIRRLMQNVREHRALGALFSNGSAQERSRFLDLLQCESTVIQ